VATIPAESPSSLAASATGDAVWFAAGTELQRIDPQTNSVTSVRPIPNACGGIAAGSTIWLATDGCPFDGSGTISSVDPVSGSIIATVTVGGPGDVAFGLDGVLVFTVTSNLILIDPGSNTVAGTLHLPTRDSGGPRLAVAANVAWVAEPDRVVAVAR